LLTWIATYLVFFTLAATKLPNYVLPVLVPSAIVTARFLDRWRRGWLTLPAWTMGAALVGLMLLGIGVSVGLLLASGVGDLAVLRGRFVPGLAAWTWIGAGPLVGGLIAWKHWRQGRCNAVLACLTLAAVILIAPMAAWGSVAFNRVKAPQPLVALSGAGQTDRDLRIGAWQLEHLPSLNFYVERDVMVVHSEKELAGFLRYPLPVYVFLPARVWEECRPGTRGLGREIARRPDIYHHEDIAVITNQVD
jgi:hypothetical protein